MSQNERACKKGTDSTASDSAENDTAPKRTARSVTNGIATTDGDGEHASILEEALETVGQRDDSHGDPVNNHEQIADLWGAYLGEILTAREVAEMMILVKLSRGQAGNPRRDHHVDIAGYCEIASMCSDYEEDRR